jgi:hypothetical protein
MLVRRGIVLLLLVIVLLVPSVLADGTLGCCGETDSGEGCFYVPDTSCATPDAFSPQLCEDTPFCEVGCCQYPDGICADGAGKYACQEVIGGVWNPGLCETVNSCDTVCCQSGSEFAYGTQAVCEDRFAGLLIEYHSVSSEQECFDIPRSQEKGCCVTEEFGCEFVTQETCGLDSVNVGSGFGFYDGDTCASVSNSLDDEGKEAALSCNCGLQESSSCEGVNIREYDSCGQPTNELTKCDYPKDACQETGSGPQCLPTTCSDTFYFEDEGFASFNEYKVYYEDAEDYEDYILYDLEESSSEVKGNGDTWCVYEGPVGGFRDRIGTQHYVATCVNGVEKIESCSSDRSEVCVAIGHRTNDGSGYVTGECVKNNFEEYYGSAAEETSFKDVIDFAIDGTGVSTVPVAGSNYCGDATLLCNVWYGDNVENKGKKEETKGWESYVNSFCLRPEFGETAADYCSSRGDCGLNLNILGEEGESTGFGIYRDPLELGTTKLKDGEGKVPVKVGIGGIDSDAKFGGCFDPQNSREGRLYSAIQQGQDDTSLDADKSEDDFDCKFHNAESFEDEYYASLSSIPPIDVVIPFQTISDNYGRKYMNSAWLDYYTLFLKSSAALEGKYEGAKTGEICKDSEDRLRPVVKALGFNINAVEAVNKFDHKINNKDPTTPIYISNYEIDISSYKIDENFGLNNFHGFLIKDEDGRYLYNWFRSIKPWYIDDVALAANGLDGAPEAEPADYINFYAGDTVCGGSNNEWTRLEHRASSTVDYVCAEWEAPREIDNCHLCDTLSTEGGLVLAKDDGSFYRDTVCNPFRCESLGSCMFKEGADAVGAVYDSSRPSCVADDICEFAQGPVISFDKTALDSSLEEFEFSENIGVYSVSNIDPGANFDFGVNINEYSECKFVPSESIFNEDNREAGITTLDQYIDSVKGDNRIDNIYDSLDVSFASSDEKALQQRVEGHSIDEENAERSVYVWCQNDCGLNNEVPYVINFETNDRPDTLPPQSFLYPTSGGFEPAVSTEVYLEVDVNKPSSCRYSAIYKEDFDSMEFSFDNEGVCAVSTSFARDYVCSTSIELEELTTSIYVLCKGDNGYAQTEPTLWTVSKSLPLVIDQVGPEGELFYNDVVLSVITSAGSENGNSICTYQQRGGPFSAVQMEADPTSAHSIDLSLGIGTYTYDIVCSDDVGNVVESDIRFEVTRDVDPPDTQGVYFIGGLLYVITDEDTVCRYEVEGEVTEDTEYRTLGVDRDLAGGLDTLHTLAVADLSETYYIYCQDTFAVQMEDPFVVSLAYLP